MNRFDGRAITLEVFSCSSLGQLQRHCLGPLKRGPDDYGHGLMLLVERRLLLPKKRVCADPVLTDRLFCATGFTKTVALETAQAGNVTCNAICPGYVLTDLIRNQLEDTAKARGIPKAITAFIQLELPAIESTLRKLG